MLNVGNATIRDQLKRISAFRGMTLNEFRNEYNKQSGKEYSQQSFSQKLNNGAIRWDELQQMGEILGFDVKLMLRDENKTGQ